MTRPNNPYVVLLDVIADEGEMYAEYLRSDGFEVLACQHTSDALEAIERKRPDAVVTRLRQAERGVTGIDVVRHLKEDVTTENLPIVMITTSAFSGDRQAATDVHCDGFMLLPVFPEQLAAEIRRVMHPLA